MKSKENVKPFDRKEAFVKILKTEYNVLVKISLAALIFALPAILVLAFCVAEMMLLGEINEGNASALYEIQARMNMWLIPSMAFFSVGASGVFYIVRRLCWGEDISFFKHLLHGIRSNAAQSVIAGVLATALIGGINYLSNILSLSSNLGSLFWIISIIKIFLFLFIAILLLFQYCIIAVYSDNMPKIIKNSLAFTVSSLPKSLGILFLMILPIILALLFSSVYWMYLILTVFMGVVGFGYAAVLFTLHSHSVFDKYINKAHFPDIYKKGLYHEGTDIDIDADDHSVEGSNLDVQ